MRQHHQDARQLERQRLIALNQRVSFMVAWVAGPIIVLNLALQAWFDPAWQFKALTTAMALTLLCWVIAFWWARQGELERSTALTMFSSLVFDAVALVLRKDTLGAALVADVCMVLYGWVFTPRLLYPGAIFAIASVSVLQVCSFFGLLPEVYGTRLLGLLLNLSVMGVSIPVTLFFTSQRQRINDLPFKELEKTARDQEVLLEAISRVQPEIDHTITRMDETSQNLLAQAQQQAITSERVTGSMEQFQQVLADTAAAAHETRTVAERMQHDSAEGWGRLEVVERDLHEFLKLFEGVRESITELSQRSESTNEIVVAIREIDEQLSILALNAAIEAARSGEAGKGFGVVANHLRAMIRETSENADRGRKLLESIREEATRSLQGTEASSGQLRANLDALRAASSLIQQFSDGFVSTSQRVSQLAASADRQQGQIKEVVRAMRDFSASVALLAKSATVLSDSMQRIGQAQQELRSLVARYHSANNGIRAEA